MKSIQLDNLLKFTFLALQENLLDMSPEYISEKWNRYINIKIKDIKIETNSILNYNELYKQWVERWGSESNSVKVIAYIIIELKQSILSFERLIEVYKKYISLNEINSDETFGGLHKLLYDYIEDFKNENIRKINLFLLIE